MFNFLEKIRAFMYGRNGFDKLSFCLLICYLLFNGTRMFFRFHPAPFYIMWIIALVFLGLALFRILSKNVYARQKEEAVFENILRRLNLNDVISTAKRRLNRIKIRITQFKTHRFRTCPQCNEHLRMSKKRGKRTVTCPKCGKRFTTFILF